LSFFRKKELRFILYAILGVEILLFSFSGFNRLSIFLISFLGIAVLANYFRQRLSEPDLWLDVKEKLTTVLIANKIIPDSPSLSPTRVPETIYRDGDETHELIIKINPNIVEELRTIGIDGILICLYLLKYRDSSCSAKVIVKDLHIPKSTVYRNIQKLVEMQYVNTQGTLDEPGKTYYKIAFEGEGLMFDFYDLLHLPGGVAQPFAKQIIKVCVGCGFSYSSNMEFCGECGIKVS